MFNVSRCFLVTMARQCGRNYYKYNILTSRYFSLLFKDSRVKSENELTKPFKRIPGPVRLPLVGNLYLYKLGYFKILEYHKVLEQLYRNYGPLVKQTLGSRTVVHVFDPDDIKTVYNNEGTRPQVAPLLETSLLYREKLKMSLGLGNTNGDEWYRLRSAVRQMMLRPKEVYYYLPFIQEVSQHFVQNIDKKKNSFGEVDSLWHEASKWSQESAGMVCFEKRLGCMSGEETEAMSELLIEANKIIFEVSGKLKFSLPIYKVMPTPKWRKLLKAEDFYYRKVIEYINETIEKLQEYVESHGSLNEKYNFMSYLLSKKELTVNDVLIITFSLYSDGLSTTVPALLYNLYCLATNPGVQENTFSEIKSVIGNKDLITVKMLNNLHYLKAVVKETFRLYPIGTETTRIIPQDLILSGFHVPAGTELHLCPNVHFTSDKYFSHPYKFLPERWLRTGDSNIHPYLLTPFGHGTRTCAGRRFAEQDLYVVLCCILRKFRLQYPDGQELEQIYNTLLFPKGPVRIQFMARE